MSQPDRLEDLGKLYMLLTQIIDSEAFSRINVDDEAFIERYLHNDMHLEELWGDLQFLYDKITRAYDISAGDDP